MDRRQLEQTIADSAQQICQQKGLKLVKTQLIRQGRRPFVRITIDKQGGVSSDDCQWLSEQLSLELDVLDPLPGSYYLEVTSPGVDRELETPEEFAEQIGNMIKVSLYAPVDGNRTVEGKLTDANDNTVTVAVNEESNVTLDYDQIAKAKLAPSLDELLGRTPRSQARAGR